MRHQPARGQERWPRAEWTLPTACAILWLAVYITASLLRKAHNMFEETVLLTPRSIANRLNISTDSVKRALRNGRIKGIKVAERGDWRITTAEFERWVSQGCPTAKEDSRDE